jgi:hypothetical protein
MDSEQLVRMLEFILEQSYQFDDVRDFLVVRNGYVVLEACSHPHCYSLTIENVHLTTELLEIKILVLGSTNIIY